MVLQSVEFFFWVVMIMMVIRIMGSWFPELQNNQLMDFVAFCVDPYMQLFRVIPPIGMIDISPMAAFLCMGFFIEPAVKAVVRLLVGG
jgi:YggT family protein